MKTFNEAVLEGRIQALERLLAEEKQLTAQLRRSLDMWKAFAADNLGEDYCMVEGPV